MAQRIQMHEDFGRKHTVKAGSNKSFGITFFVALSLLGLVPLLGGSQPRWWLIGIGVAFLLAALVYPSILTRPNEWWMKFGLLLHRIVSPIIIGFMFYIVLAPMGIALRLLGKDLLSMKFDREASTYWIERTDGPEPETMKNQF